VDYKTPWVVGLVGGGGLHSLGTPTLHLVCSIYVHSLLLIDYYMPHSPHSIVDKVTGYATYIHTQFLLFTRYSHTIWSPHIIHTFVLVGFFTGSYLVPHSCLVIPHTRRLFPHIPTQYGYYTIYLDVNLHIPIYSGCPHTFTFLWFGTGCFDAPTDGLPSPHGSPIGLTPS